MARHNESFKFFLRPALNSLSCDTAAPGGMLAVGMRSRAMNRWMVQLTQSVLAVAGLLGVLAFSGLLQ